MSQHGRLSLPDNAESEKSLSLKKFSDAFVKGCGYGRIISHILDGRIKKLLKPNKLGIFFHYTLYEMGGKESFSEISSKLENV